jgi:fumarate hydratase subunit alpha
MRQVSALSIIHAVRESSIHANFELGHDVIHAYRHALTHEESSVGKDILHQLIQNAEIAGLRL